MYSLGLLTLGKLVKPATHENSVEGDAAMASTPLFLRECPTCGRPLQIRVQFLGRRVACDHCGAQFRADSSDSSGHDLMHRAEELLRQSGERPIPPTI